MKIPKYFHIEIISGELYAYADDKIRHGELITLESIGNECHLGDAESDKHFVIPTIEFVN